MGPGAGWKTHQEKMQQNGVPGDIKTEKKPHRPKYHQNTSKTTKQNCKKHNKQKNNRSKQENPTNPTLSMLQIFRFAYNQNLPQVLEVFLTDFKQALGPFLLFHLQYKNTLKLATRLAYTDFAHCYFQMWGPAPAQTSPASSSWASPCFGNSFIST